MYFKCSEDGMQYSDIPGLPWGKSSKIQFQLTSPLSPPIKTESEIIQSSIQVENSLEPSRFTGKPFPIVSGKSSGPLRNYGESIPDPEQYQKLISQAKTIYENLPAHIQLRL
jgi:hypothetical protein